MNFLKVYISPPMGKSILNHPKRQADVPMKIGVIGLGVGTLSAYARTNDESDSIPVHLLTRECFDLET